MEDIYIKIKYEEIYDGEYTPRKIHQRYITTKSQIANICYFAQCKILSELEREYSLIATQNDKGEQSEYMFRREMIDDHLFHVKQ